MSNETLEQRVIKSIAEQLGFNVDEIKLDSKFTTDLGADSLDLVELTMLLEENFGIEIDDSDLSSLVDVQSIIDYIKDKINK